MSTQTEKALLNGGTPVVSWYSEADDLPLPSEGIVAITGMDRELVERGFEHVSEIYRDQTRGNMRDIAANLEEPQFLLLGSAGAALMRQQSLICMVPMINDLREKAIFSKEIDQCFETLHKHAHEYRSVVLVGKVNGQSYRDHLTSLAIRSRATEIIEVTRGDNGSLEFLLTSYE